MQGKVGGGTEKVGKAALGRRWEREDREGGRWPRGAWGDGSMPPYPDPGWRAFRFSSVIGR